MTWGKGEATVDLTGKPITMLQQIGPARAARLARLGLATVMDVLTYYPRRYEVVGERRDIAALQPDLVQCVAGAVIDMGLSHVSGRRTKLRVTIRDSSGSADLVWFNQPYRSRAWQRGQKLLVVGKATKFHDRWCFVCPNTEKVKSLSDVAPLPLLPLYGLTEGVSQTLLRGIVRQALEKFGTDIMETMPASVVRQYRLTGRRQAIWDIHFPVRAKDLQAARHRLAFEELFHLQCRLRQMKRARRCAGGIKHTADSELVQRVEAALPFSLTLGQQAALTAIKNDMETERPMWRLLQGDVGSGKTVVAALALAKTVENGCQGALMAPTEILAEQHFHTLRQWLAPAGVNVVLLHGGMTTRVRLQTEEALRTGAADIAVGTHTLLNPAVRFARLGLVVTDEQHRFGVVQRAALVAKGNVPHVLLMTATPIPRTLALTIYGDLDISRIPDLPPGRRPVKTYLVGTDWRGRVYEFVRQQIIAGHQAYIVCPLIGDAEQIDNTAATTLYEQLLCTRLRGINCALLHGRLSSREKESIMARFQHGEVKVLIATSIVEVGVNVPDATVMVIEGAECFGLAQLHQLRGRVGRGAQQSFCILVTDSDNPAIWRRLKLVAQTQDGLALAEQDLLSRGPGEFFGTSQHGLPASEMVTAMTDSTLLKDTHEAASKWLERESMLGPWEETRLRRD